MRVTAPPPPSPAPPLQGTRYRESDRMARYCSSDEEEDEEATAVGAIVGCDRPFKGAVGLMSVS